MMTSRERAVRNTAWAIVRAAREVQSAVEMFDDELSGKAGAFNGDDNTKGAEDNLRLTIYDLQQYVNDFRGLE